MEIDFLDVTELAEAHVTRQQVGRLLQRYSWAGQFCDGKDVLELACGNGMGLGYLSSVAKSLVGGDVSPTLVKRTNRHYGSRIDVRVMDAQNTGLIDASFDVIILFEAIYYLQAAESFIQESFRLLRPRGVVLIVTTNKDLYDFTPSLHSVAYYGVPELNNLLRTQGFDCEFYGGNPVNAASWRLRLMRPIKAIATKFQLIPKTMNSKRFLKRIVFGKLVEMPSEIPSPQTPPTNLTRLRNDVCDTSHMTIFCVARKP